MSDVVCLDDYRGRREARFRQTVALHGADPDRKALVLRLWEALQLVDADRGAVVWIDEYGPGMVHVHCLLDVASDRPRRAFAVEPLRRAWEEGIPGLLDEPELTRSSDRILPEGPRSLCAVALGSDGVRAWFLVADSRTPRSPLSESTAESVMFVAGECASVVLHQDLVEDDGESETEPHFERLRRDRFSGWPVLQDVSGPEHAAGDDEAITVRFLVTRLLRSLAEDDFAREEEAVRHQVESIRAEMSGVGEGRERRSWERVLDAVETGDDRELARAAIELADVVEARGHLNGARELDRIAYDLAAVARDLETAVDASRQLGRVSRRLGELGDSERWYRVGREVARSGDLRRHEALVLDGLGNTYRVRGNHPEAREIYEDVLTLGRELDDRHVRGSAHHNLMLVEKHAGRTDEALRHGWSAVEAFASDFHALAALTDLGDVFLRSGELNSAETAFEVVAARSEILDARVIALDALAHIAARRRDLAGFQKRLQRLDPEMLESAAVEVRAQVLLYRGRSYVALGEPAVAERWFRRSRDFAEEHGINRILFEAEEALRELEEGGGGDGMLENELPKPTAETVSELREPLASLRRSTPAGAGA